MKDFLIAGTLLFGIAVAPVQAQYSESLGDYDGPAVTSGFPLAPVLIGTFTPGASLFTAMISGTYGTAIVPSSTAGYDLFLDGILVSQCVYPDPGCWGNGADYRPWSYTFSGAELSIFDDGVADLTVVQTSATNVRIGGITLEGRFAATSVPEPASLLLLGMGLFGVGVVARGRRNGDVESHG
jgi:hypothetical protein